MEKSSLFSKMDYIFSKACIVDVDFLYFPVKVIENINKVLKSEIHMYDYMSDEYHMSDPVKLSVVRKDMEFIFTTVRHFNDEKFQTLTSSQTAVWTSSEQGKHRSCKRAISFLVTCFIHHKPF